MIVLSKIFKIIILNFKSVKESHQVLYPNPTLERYEIPNINIYGNFEKELSYELLPSEKELIQREGIIHLDVYLVNFHFNLKKIFILIEIIKNRKYS